MDYGALLRRTWEIVWNNKWLLVLGIIIALASGNTVNNPATSGGDEDDPSTEYDLSPYFEDYEGDFEDFARDFDFDEFSRTLPVIGGIGLALLIPLVCFFMLIGLIVWALSTIARGGLIAAASALDDEHEMNFREAWQAGWAKGWRLIGIGILPGIPGLILLVISASMLGGVLGFANLSGGRALAALGTGLGITLAAVACLSLIASIVLGLLRYLANRACMLQDLSVMESYRLGWQVLQKNFGKVFPLFLLEIAMRLTIGFVLLIPNVFIALCCILWPLRLLIDGSLITYFSTMWTLAWREWTGPTASSEPVIDAPAV